MGRVESTYRNSSTNYETLEEESDATQHSSCASVAGSRRDIGTWLPVHRLILRPFTSVHELNCRSMQGGLQRSEGHLRNSIDLDEK